MTFGVSALNSQLPLLDSTLDDFDLSGLSDSLDPSGQLDSLSVDTSGFNFSAFSFPPLTAEQNLNTTQKKLTYNIANLTAASFDSDRGNVQTMQSSLNVFNQYASQLNSSWQAYTYA